MSADFKVDPSALSDLANRILSLVSELGQASGISPDLGAAGHNDVERGISDFIAHWQGEIGKATQMLQDLGGHLEQAAETYSQSDTTLSSAFGGN